MIISLNCDIRVNFPLLPFTLRLSALLLIILCMEGVCRYFFIDYIEDFAEESPSFGNSPERTKIFSIIFSQYPAPVKKISRRQVPAVGTGVLFLFSMPGFRWKFFLAEYHNPGEMAMDGHFSPMRHGCRLRACRSFGKPLLFCLEKSIGISAWKTGTNPRPRSRNLPPRNPFDRSVALHHPTICLNPYFFSHLSQFTKA